MENKKKMDEDLVYRYNLVLVVIGFVIFIGGIIIGQENTTVTIYIWTGGVLLLVLMSLLKDILKELRIINKK